MRMRQIDVLEHFLAFSEAKRPWVYAIAAASAAIIGVSDWLVINVSLGFLYIVPVLLASATLTFPQILLFATLCGVLRELFSPLHQQPGVIGRTMVGAIGFLLAGFFVSELNRKRKLVTQHLEEREEQFLLRRQAEEQLRAVIDTSPLAILTLDSVGKVMLANESARQVLGFQKSLQGKEIQPYLPILARFLTMQHPASGLRTAVESRGQRANGEVFLANIWLSTFATGSGPQLAACIWDASENLRDREGTGLNSMMATSRVLIGAVSHEIRNLAAAALSAHHGLESVPGIDQVEHFRALRTIITGLERIAESGLRLGSHHPRAIANLGMVLDEARVVIEPAFREAGISIDWQFAEGLPLVQGDHHSLLQVFLNLARNSEQALESCAHKTLTVTAGLEKDLVMVRFRDTGPGISNPDDLFKPFQPGAHSAGLGLYISRAVVRSHGGDLLCEPQLRGACFALQLWPAEDDQERQGS
ncbi:MAG: PAS domain-containing sensor histidine kinase [Acidobacteriia bacterium]|nr:PAS domain-containing sensor histidine kinase [Terriglobia bacterium]